MRTDTQTITRLEDYRPPDYLIDTVELDIRLDPAATRIRSVLKIRPNPAGRSGAPLVLDGDELLFHGLAVDGEPAPPDSYEATPEALTLREPPAGPFALTVDTEVNPSANTKLMGLYRSNGVYCTQCEADGFRRISYLLDRPDVLSVYTTRIEAEREEAPVLLGNGNLRETGEVEGTTRHFAVWHDPHPKPAYLFAVVGGDLARTAKTFRTMSGREVEIAVYVEPGKEDRSHYALDALERSMRWDERVFGREYDLDVFNVVAVSDFNMGAMENKGLNIFNDKYVLASPDTATDADYANIEAVIAHEYFHNWTGNRITCRDWFQLCLKEGLTVFRDQEFSSDERSRAVHRIAEVRTLRARQFAEDAGPLAHPVRPTRYREINNFYTATVYEKGAEIVRMLKTLLGDATFARGMERYFERCDGTAATVEDFLDCFAEVSGRDLGHFKRWYEQAGTPTVTVGTAYDPQAGTYRLDFRQETAPTPGQPDKAPLVIPVLLGLVAEDGGRLDCVSNNLREDGLFVLESATDSLSFEGVRSRPVPSLFRGFSAPVRVELDLPDSDLLTLLRHDTDPFNRWQSAQTVALRLLTALARDPSQAPRDEFPDAIGAFLDRSGRHDPAFTAMVLALPGETEIAQEIGRDVDPDAVHAARDRMKAALGHRLGERLRSLRDAFPPEDRYSPDAASAGRRALRNAALDLIAAGDPAGGERLAAEQFERATNMTDRLAALVTLSLIPGEVRETTLARFGELYAAEPLVLDKWFALQAAIPEEGTLARVRELMNHPAFAFSNPNRVRSLIGSFAMANPTQFHREDGAGYALLAEAVLALNGTNPQIAARLLTGFGTWRSMNAPRRAQAQAALERIAGAPNLSPDVLDIVQRSLAPT
ncbi:aminopeptidase N [Enterovirga aerilata]|uniref:Aminopeptidase N n=1 Tax=Enterovirga aerilata TaxID=2730920 RepID=A0A849I7N1_9HYPH|nr:aminopeptidase N [Enterovirga sp. DB1703]